MDINTTEFNMLAKKIKIKRIIALICIIAFVLLIVFSVPLNLEVNDYGATSIDVNGAVTLAIRGILGALVSFFMYLIFSSPIYNSLFQECDARKHLFLLKTLENEKFTYPALANAYAYIGDFDTAIYYDKKAYENKSRIAKLHALYGKATNEFFAERIDDFRNTAFEFQSLTKKTKLNDKQRQKFLKCHRVINLLLAISNKDLEKIKEFSSLLEPFDKTVISTVFINYLKGLSSFELKNKAECTYRFMSVCDVASKTALGVLAKEYLDKINGKSDTEEN